MFPEQVFLTHYVIVTHYLCHARLPYIAIKYLYDHPYIEDDAFANVMLQLWSMSFLKVVRCSGSVRTHNITHHGCITRCVFSIRDSVLRRHSDACVLWLVCS